MLFQQIQLTTDNAGHCLHHMQVFSPDGKWIVFDSRNDDSKIGSTGHIRMINIDTKEIKELYQTSNQAEYGPGVGAATFSPVDNTVIFIHGIRNASKGRPYGFTRRTGVAIHVDKPQMPVFMDARDINAPFTPGALRGGTHAHGWSADGNWISFTYNDYVMEQLGKTDHSVKDLRTVGVMKSGHQVQVPDDAGMENNSGEMFSVIVTRVTEIPAPGSDDIDKAFDECWIGTKGYRRGDGRWQERAIAFQGNTYDEQGKVKTELFVVDIPEVITVDDTVHPIAGTATQRPAPPSGVKQRRITHSTHGVLGPRHWLRSLPDGSLIGFLSKDENNTIQVMGVSPNGGDIKQLSHSPSSITSPFSFSPDGQYVSYIADNSVFIEKIGSAKPQRLTTRVEGTDVPVGAVLWSPDGKSLAYNKYVTEEEGRYLQIFLLR